MKPKPIPSGRAPKSISPKNRLILWVRAGGRCEYAGCNRHLLGDIVSGSEKLNKAFVAHIVAADPKGPRGDPLRSHALADSLENVMLLCHPHHHLIDEEDEPGHPEARLVEMKAVHEARIAKLTGIAPTRGSHVLHFASRIGAHDCLVTRGHSDAALLPERYPLDRSPIQLEIVGTDYRDDEPAYWALQVDTLRRQFDRLVAERRRTGDIAHLSAFAIGPQPLLVELGRLLSDIADVEVHQRSREPVGWTWREDGDPIDFIVERPAEPAGKVVALSLGISAQIDQQRIFDVLGSDVQIWTVRAVRPGNDILRRRGCLARFRNEMRDVYRDIHFAHGGDAVIHIFPAVPVAMAVEIGRVWMPKANPSLVVYDEHRGLGGFVARLEIGAPRARLATSRLTDDAVA